MEVIKMKLQFFFDEGENVNQAAEIGNGVYGRDTSTVSYMQFSFCRFCSGIFVAKHASRTGMLVSDDIEKISSRSVAQKLKIGHKTFKPFV